MLLHSVSSFRERLDNQIFIYIPPSPLGPNQIGLYHRSDIVSDILLLSALVVKGDRMRCEVTKGVLDVDLWTTSYADVKLWKVQPDELSQKAKDLLARGRNSDRKSVV